MEQLCFGIVKYLRVRVFETVYLYLPGAEKNSQDY